MDGFCLGVCYHWSLLNNALSYFVLVALVDFLDSTRHVLVSGKDDNPEEKTDDVLTMILSEWSMILCNHHVIREEEENSNDHDGTGLNQSILLCFLLLSVLDNDDVMTNTVVET